ncbi:MAG: extracellular solute-binding protein [Eubacteriales bacterium]
MVKKILAVAMIGCFVFINIACDVINPKTDYESKLDPENPVTITLWHYYFDEKEQILNNFVEKFNSTVGIEKGIVVEPVNKGRIIDLEAALTDSANGVVNSDKMPNIFSTYIDKAVELTKLNKMVDLNDYFSEEEKQEFVNSFVETGSFGKKFMVIPIAKSTEILYVNKTKWDEIKEFTGHTDEDLATWEGISEVAGDYLKMNCKGTGKAEIGFFGYESLENLIILAMKEQGVEVIDGEDKIIHLNEPELKKFFNMYFGNMITSKFFIEGKFRTDNVQTGSLVAYTGSTAGAKYFPTAVVENGIERPVELLALRYPTFKGMRRYSFLQGAGMAVAKASDAEVEASIEFLKWFTKDENNLKFAVKTGYLPSKKALYEKNTFDKTIEKLREDGLQSDHLASIYEISREIILSENTYYVKPFEKSYKVRQILGETLNSCVEEGLENPSKYNGVNMEMQFDIWLKRVKQQLDRNEIQYE